MTDAYVDPLYAEDVSVGDAAPAVTVENLECRDFVRYAGASGDFNPIHYDLSYAESTGNTDVFAQGMFTAGVAAHGVTDWFGLENVTRFRTRFLARVFPGDTVTFRGTITDVQQTDNGSTSVEADIAVANQNGELVISGDVTAVLPSRR